jgi:hypothetical protein
MPKLHVRYVKHAVLSRAQHVLRCLAYEEEDAWHMRRRMHGI